MTDTSIPFDQTNPVRPDDLKPGLVVWASLMDAPVTVRTVVQGQSVIFQTAQGRRLVTPVAALEGPVVFYYHLHEQPDDAITQLRAMALELIDRGNQILALLDLMGTK